METERIAYVVTSGCYSDYGIEAIFDNEAAALEYIGDDTDESGYGKRIEEHTINSTLPKTIEYWTVTVVHSNPEEGKPNFWPSEIKRATEDWVKTRQGSPHARYFTPVKDYAGTYMAEAVHFNLDTARKIANDLLAQLIYEHQLCGITSLPLEKS